VRGCKRSSGARGLACPGGIRGIRGWVGGRIMFMICDREGPRLSLKGWIRRKMDGGLQSEQGRGLYMCLLSICMEGNLM
jgi:hypothetical protein